MSHNDNQCAICWEPINSEDCGSLWLCPHKRSCRHMFHVKCANEILSSREVICNCPRHRAKCPCCRTAFFRVFSLPDVRQSPGSWFRHVAAIGASGACGVVVADTIPADHLLEALSAQYALDSNAKQTLTSRLADVRKASGSDAIDFDHFIALIREAPLPPKCRGNLNPADHARTSPTLPRSVDDGGAAAAVAALREHEAQILRAVEASAAEAAAGRSASAHAERELAAAQLLSWWDHAQRKAEALSEQRELDEAIRRSLAEHASTSAQQRSLRTSGPRSEREPFAETGRPPLLEISGASTVSR